MCKESNYIIITSFPIYLPIYKNLFLEQVINVKPNNNLIGLIHPQLNNHGHPMDDALMDDGLF